MRCTDKETSAYRKKFRIHGDGWENFGRMRLEKEQRQNPVDDQYFRNARCCQIKQNKLFRKENLERVKVNEITNTSFL